MYTFHISILSDFLRVVNGFVSSLFTFLKMVQFVKLQIPIDFDNYEPSTGSLVIFFVCR